MLRGLPDVETHRRGCRALFGGALAFAGVAIANAGTTGVASAQIREGDPIAEIYHVYQLDDLFVNTLQGWACAGNSIGESVYDDGPNFLFGSIAGSGPDVLRLPMTIGPCEQRFLISVGGIDDNGNLFYNAICNGGFLTGQSSVWMNDTLVEIADAPSGYGDTFWAGVNARSVTRDGTLLLYGTLTSTPGGEPEQAGLFFGSGATPLLLGGQSIPNVPHNLDMTAFATPTGTGFSSNGTNYITAVDMEGVAGKDTALVMNGEGLMLGGTLVRYDNTIPASIGGLPGETYRLFHGVGINEKGDYFITGLSDGVNNNRSIIKNGVILHRQGDVLDGVTLAGGSIDAALNEDGDLVFNWSFQSGQAALWFNGEIILQENDLVDWDGDGVVDAGYSLYSIREVAISDRKPEDQIDVYFIGHTSTPRGLREALFVITHELPQEFSIADFVTSRTFQPPPDGNVDAADLAFLLGEWGPNPGSPADIVDSATFQPPPDGVVDAADLAFLLGEWSP